MYKSVLQLDEKNVAVINNLAWLLRESDLSQARKYAEKAKELSPNDGAVNDALLDIKKRPSRFAVPLMHRNSGQLYSSNAWTVAVCFLEVQPRQKTWPRGNCGPICGGTFG